MATVTTVTGFGTSGFPATLRMPPRAATTRGRRLSSTIYLRRRIATALLTLGIVVVAGQAGAALGGSSPLAVSERRPTIVHGSVVVRPGDSLWSIATRLAPGEDPRPVVDQLTEARHGAALVPGETVRWPK